MSFAVSFSFGGISRWPVHGARPGSEAVRRLARDDRRPMLAALQRRRARVEPQLALLLIRPMAADAPRLEQRLDLPGEITAAGSSAEAEKQAEVSRQAMREQCRRRQRHGKADRMLASQRPAPCDDPIIRACGSRRHARERVDYNARILRRYAKDVDG